MSSVYPPQPCERCVRSKKTCKGIAGARCEHCKILHQKCSNSSGPPRGRNAGKFGRTLSTMHDRFTSVFAFSGGRRNSSSTNLENGSAGPSSSQPRPKRKAATTKFKPDDDGDDEDEDEEDEVEKPTPAPKKRRVGNNAGPRRSRLLKDVAELEGAIKKLQTTFVKDLTKLQQLAGSLATEIREMEDA
jgi:hypothetical protein